MSSVPLTSGLGSAGSQGMGPAQLPSVLNWGGWGMILHRPHPQARWQYLGTFLVVTVEGGCYCRLAGGGQRCC